MTRSISACRQIDAEASEIFSVLTDPAMHSVIDGSGTIRDLPPVSAERLRLGTQFSLKMKLGINYVMKNTVVEFHPNRLIAWTHFGGHRWRYQLEPNENGTLVTETFDWSKARSARMIELVGYPHRNLAAMVQTLARLEDLVVEK